MTKKSVEETQYTTTVLTPGLYRLAQGFKHPRPDKRRTGTGLGTPDGFPEGTRFTLKLDVRPTMRPEIGTTFVELIAPFATGLTTVAHGIVHGGVTRWWIGDEPASIVESLLSKLVPDPREEAWLDDALGAGRHMTGFHADVLLHLLESGRITRDDITTALAAVEAKLDAQDSRDLDPYTDGAQG